MQRFIPDSARHGPSRVIRTPVLAPKLPAEIPDLTVISITYLVPGRSAFGSEILGSE